MLIRLFRPAFGWQDWFVNFQRSFLVLLAPWLISVLAQSAGRGYLLLRYAAPGTYDALPQDVRRTLATGLLFDIKVASIACSALLLLSMAAAARPGLQRRWQRHLPGLGAAMATLFAAITIISVFYFATFSRSIDIFVFGLVDDDTQAILMTLWHGYPLAQAGLLLAAVLAGTWWLGRRWRGWVQGMLFKRRAFIPSLLRFALIIGVTVLACRGSLGKFPLNKDDTSISSLRLLNDIAPNGVSAFSWALSDRGNDKRFEPVTLREGRQLYERFLGWPDVGLRPFMAATGPHPAAAARPPHVVLQVMESMGAHLNSYDRPGRDVLGALRPHWSEDWVFERFVAEGNGTIESLSLLLVRSPIAAVGQSSAVDAPFASNAFTPFLQRGYRVVFVTSGAATWRNLGVFATKLGAHEFVDQQTLKVRYPQARTGTWGVPDEYMFRYIEERLAQGTQDSQPLFIIALSTTHHPPFIVPDGGQRGGLPLDDVASLPYFKTWDALAAAFDTLRYANDQLGRFLTRLKASDYASRTIVAVTGDHNILGIDYQDPKDAALARAVPFYLYVPPAYRAQARYDPARVGSHKDILPTLYHLSLPQTAYFRSGCDLLAAQPDPAWCFGFNSKHVLLTDEGVFRPDKPGRILPWAGPSGLALEEEQDATAEQWAEQVRLNAYTELLHWQINYQVQELGRAGQAR
ncbi:LTA synthase family protein [Achromobacter sp. ACM02]|uniref:LTA synthase family protein n=1 Tax=Achromobacter TaxID=222 RepID=UPI000F73EED3|nr:MULTISPECIES: LTA synthase family protein [Achromobacter]MBD9383051.1 LTA synthase family protein [Achromobacter sp. ACM02]RSE92981.1 LTA synthase family protein [Achromobacter aegrifaciens]